MPIHTYPVCGAAQEVQPILHDFTYGHPQPTVREYIDSTFTVMHSPELVTTSASGLDPHIKPAARIATGTSIERIKIGQSGRVPDRNEHAHAANH